MPQSGGNAIPLGKRKASAALEPPQDSDSSDLASDTDEDEPLPGELDSDAEDLSDEDSDVDSQMQTDFGMDSNDQSQQDDRSDASSDDDMPIAVERQGATARKPAVLPKVHASAKGKVQQPQQQSLQTQQQAGSSYSDSAEESEGEEHVAEDSGAARRSSHEVGLLQKWCTAQYIAWQGSLCIFSQTTCIGY